MSRLPIWTPSGVNSLWLGGRSEASDHKWLRSRSIDVVITIAGDKISNVCDDCEYHFVNVKDDAKNMPFRMIVMWLLTALFTKHQNVLIHCEDGKNRSAAAVLRFLMDVFGFMLKEAFVFVVMHRPIANPSKAFLLKLKAIDNQRDQKKYVRRVIQRLSKLCDQPIELPKRAPQVISTFENPFQIFC
jgi:hypothetical protein